MRKEWLIAAALLLAGCATAPIGPQNREEWQALHMHVISGVTEKQVLDASEKVLRLADHDFKFDYPDHQLLASRQWSFYAVLAAGFGVDNWRITTKEVTGGVSVTVEISRQSNAITPMPTVGVAGPGAGGIGVGAGATPMPGQSISGEFPYAVFWQRLDFMLGKSSHWPNCKEAEKVPRPQRINSDVLCSVSTDDKAPS